MHFSFEKRETQTQGSIQIYVQIKCCLEWESTSPNTTRHSVVIAVLDWHFFLLDLNRHLNFTIIFQWFRTKRKKRRKRMFRLYC